MKIKRYCVYCHLKIKMKVMGKIDYDHVTQSGRHCESLARPLHRGHSDQTAP